MLYPRCKFNIYIINLFTDIVALEQTDDTEVVTTEEAEAAEMAPNEEQEVTTEDEIIVEEVESTSEPDLDGQLHCYGNNNISYPTSASGIQKIIALLRTISNEAKRFCVLLIIIINKAYKAPFMTGSQGAVQTKIAKQKWWKKTKSIKDF